MPIPSAVRWPGAGQRALSSAVECVSVYGISWFVPIFRPYRLRALSHSTLPRAI